MHALIDVDWSRWTNPAAQQQQPLRITMLNETILKNALAAAKRDQNEFWFDRIVVTMMMSACNFFPY